MLTFENQLQANGSLCLTKDWQLHCSHSCILLFHSAYKKDLNSHISPFIQILPSLMGYFLAHSASMQ